ncbi:MULTISPECIES: DUF5107 domain-containing protein [unclassified Sphingobacterium]|uniref:DUF5107 domain-containing protein n=1 Tax=unclassified Sphingobacterium TaxID=2609468 RepID=UPI001048A471|nr:MULTISPECIES: DUF5107 domain-containing protein [unclassified Sphingobacterium]MCS3553691.1 tetratricopeptide (TPR) repeat protein [Sphingobacterium sp. JUb21]TCR01469.1 uncharacterized protein DUF5107 [Sphingobacterium sp. JUb20]
MKKWIILLTLTSSLYRVQGQSPASITEIYKQYTTYPFSDPDPIAAPQKLYPYFRFDGFSHKAVEKKWKAVLLENDYIRVQVMPEIGGKIWSAYDKVNKRDYIYNNDVVKFRDIAMRGPWTSGGIEANYGIIGHTPNTSTPVDYRMIKNEDGSVSCLIHAFDLLSRSHWTLEIKLEKDKGYFSTRSFWTNANAVEQPYYTWMNLGVAASEDLHFLYPGNKYIGHDGDTHPWPMDSQGRDLSTYRGNAFGSSKSYHVLGIHSNTFGVYYADQNQGMMRYALREDKLGKKIFLWSQAGDGQIWEELLTDRSGQYVEIQSGRLFNQNVPSSSLTPFKQVGFAPYQSDVWTEYWMPFAGIGKPADVQLSAAISFEKKQQELLITIDPKRTLKDTVRFLDGKGNAIESTFLKADVGAIQKLTVGSNSSEQVKILQIGTDYFDLKLSDEEKQLNRPTQILPEEKLDSNTVKLYEARDFIRFRQYEQAAIKLKELDRDQYRTSEMMLEMSKLAWFKMDYQEGYNYARQALAIDTYAAAANYYYGLHALKLGKNFDALDGLEVATLDPNWRSAAYTQLARYYYRIQQYQRSIEYAEKAVLANAMNIEALQICYLLNDKQDRVKVEKYSKILAHYDPFNAFLIYEEGRKMVSQQEFSSQTVFELAIWYAGLHEYQKAKMVLQGIVMDTEMLYWMAWLSRNDVVESAEWMKKAETSNPLFVFPFREESETVFAWVQGKQKSWKINYLMALLYRFRNQKEHALDQLKHTNEPIDFAPFYAMRSGLEEKDLAVDDMRRAGAIDHNEWRYGLHLTEILNNQTNYGQALIVISDYERRFPKNYIIGLTLIRTLLLNEQYAKAEKALEGMDILPFEGATEGHRYYVQSKLMLAYQYILKKEYKAALRKIAESRNWPKNLGAGEPYADEKNELLADWLMAILMKQQGNNDAEKNCLQQVKNQIKSRNIYEKLLQQIAAEKLGENITILSNVVSERACKMEQQIREGRLERYWPELIRAVYFSLDDRMF